MEANAKPRLRRDLKLVDVYAISTGAMFSSGFFLLPGIAFAYCGGWMVFAYAASAIIVVPAMLSKAELATGLPKAGGTYYFLDRSMGPLVGTVGGLGTWIAMGLKNTFALIGIGAYLSLFFDVEITPVAIAGAVGFTLINIVGVKETAKLQRLFVYAMVLILMLFVVSGFLEIGAGGLGKTSEVFASAPSADIDGVLATIGLVFVSYAGLTKVSSVAEEVDRPDRNILLGMALSLGTAFVLYTVGTFVLVMVIDHGTLASDLTPIATAAESIFDWMPGRVGLFVVFVAATAAFASTANAGILSASRYLLAMGRDRIIAEPFGKIGRLQTPTLAVLATGSFIVVALLTLDVISVAKLASAFQLLMFAFVNLAVIVMRESQIQTYDPPFRSPLYPWMQLAGIFTSLGLILILGRLAILFTMGIVALSAVWYFIYAKKRVMRRGAILHWFERLGRERSEDLEREIWSILKDAGLRDEDPYVELIERAEIIEVEESATFNDVAGEVSARMAAKVPLEANAIAAEFERGVRTGLVPVTSGIAMPHFRVLGLERHELVIVRARPGITIGVGEEHPSGKQELSVQALFFLLSPEQKPGQHLRILAKLASQLERPDFIESWVERQGPHELRVLLEGDALRELAQQVTARIPEETSPAPAWRAPSGPGEFANVLVLHSENGSQEASAELAAHLASTRSSRLTLVGLFESDRRRLAPDTDTAVATYALATDLEDLATPLRARGLEVDTAVLRGKPWLEVIRRVVRENHDLVVAGVDEGHRRGFDSFARHLLRKCPCPVWMVRPHHRSPHRRVLAAVDASANDTTHAALNTQILKLATALGRGEEVELHIAYAWHLVGKKLMRRRGATEYEIAAWREEHREQYARALNELLGNHGITYAQARIHLLEGDPSEVLPRFATENDIDVIVIGTVCRTGVAGLLIGNTAEDIIDSVECSVLAIKPPGFKTPVDV